MVFVIGMIKAGWVESLGGNRAKELAGRMQQLPQFGGSRGSTREPTRAPDNGNRFRNFGIHIQLMNGGSERNLDVRSIVS